MSGYSLVILICSIALSHADCQPKTATDVVRGPPVDNPVMCGLNAQTMIARTDLVRGGRKRIHESGLHAIQERRPMDGRDRGAQGCAAVSALDRNELLLAA